MGISLWRWIIGMEELKIELREVKSG